VTVTGPLAEDPPLTGAEDPPMMDPEALGGCAVTVTGPLLDIVPSIGSAEDSPVMDSGVLAEVDGKLG